MNNFTWNDFEKIKKKFRRTTDRLSDSLPQLKNIQQELVNRRANGKNQPYGVETPVVYNTALDDIKPDDDIKLILVADNPGRHEQAAERYLCSQAGTIAKKFYLDNPVLRIDFCKNVMVLNKTPIYSPYTVDLKKLAASDIAVGKALEKSQENMAHLLLEFQETLDVPVWITGYSEMKKGGIFETYTETLKTLYADHKKLFGKVLIFQHFSRNCFTTDLKMQTIADDSLTKNLKRIGSAYRKRILG